MDVDFASLDDEDEDDLDVEAVSFGEKIKIDLNLLTTSGSLHTV